MSLYANETCQVLFLSKLAVNIFPFFQDPQTVELSNPLSRAPIFKYAVNMIQIKAAVRMIMKEHLLVSFCRVLKEEMVVSFFFPWGGG